ncbi:MAG TPA: hypothetical protein DET40_02965 [Lentisphaeria bacterium]|nr:MAG: hypothetical protein A2X45_14150 [Lentisphaerae bacterium GWF2_50_93]HCE42491.1 hypothetical protein [Lentisphaeria bacterium]
MKSIIGVCMLMISMIAFGAGEKPAKLIVDGDFIVKAEEGIIVKCPNFSYNPPMAIKGDDPQKNQEQLDKYNKDYSDKKKKYVEGAILLKGYKGGDKKGKGDSIKTYAIESGVIEKYTIDGTVIADPLHVYTAIDEPVE